MANQQLEALEGRFAAQSNTLHEKVLDLNCSMSDIAALSKGIMNMRNQLMVMYGVPADPEWNPNAPAGVSASSSGVTAPAAARIKPPAGTLNVGAALQAMDPDEVNWKSLLNTAMGKTKKIVLAKDTIVYTHSGSVAEGGFWCTVSSKFLTQEYSNLQPCATKKAAEGAAAMVVVQAEFAECMVANVPKRKAESLAVPGVGGGGGGPVAVDKGAVCPYVQAVLGRPLAKTDMIYTVADQGNGTFVGTVNFPSIDEAQVFSGPPAASRKEAENEAAKACMPWLQSVAGPALEQLKAKKAKKGPGREKPDKVAKAPSVVHAAKTPGAQVPLRQAVPAGAQQFVQQLAAQQLGAQQQFGVQQQLGMQNMVNMAGNVGRWGW